MKKVLVFVVFNVFVAFNVAQGAFAQPRFRMEMDATNPDVHDPVIAYCEGRYYIYATGFGVQCMSSEDLKTWKMESSVLTTPPQWAMDCVKGYRGHTWAPDIQYYDGLWYLFYSCSAFGKNTSAIGVAVNKTLNPSSPDYEWVDKGKVVESIPGKDNWNAIDPNMIVDDKGKAWLCWGSFWDGVQLVKLKGLKGSRGSKVQGAQEVQGVQVKGTPKTIARRFYRTGKHGKPSAEDLALASEAPDAGANAIEAPYIIKEGDWYYLFVSWDYCCKGRRSNYKTVVGRSKSVEGPYLDKQGRRMDEGGGEILLQASDRYYGVGHCGLLKKDGEWLFVAHGYAKLSGGQSKLFLRRMVFDSEGWPVIESEADPLVGKTMNVIGDSYVANHRRPKEESWHSKLAQIHGMHYNNYGRNGNCVAFDRGRFGTRMVNRYTEMTDTADVIIIIAGHNDANMIKDDADSLVMFRDSLDKLLTGLREKYPAGRIGYVTPWYLDKPGFAQVVKTVKEVCEKHAVPVLDNYMERSPIRVRDDRFRERFFQSPDDTAHLNAEGHDMYLATGERFLQQLIQKGS